MPKVKLPREVVAALDSETKGKNDEMLSWTLFNTIKLQPHCLTDDARTIKEYFVDGELMILARALVNGYEVEETPEDKVMEYYKMQQAAGKFIINHVLDILNIKIDGVNS